jgi:hypothetical protein
MEIRMKKLIEKDDEGDILTHKPGKNGSEQTIQLRILRLQICGCKRERRVNSNLYEINPCRTCVMGMDGRKAKARERTRGPFRKAILSLP